MIVQRFTVILMMLAAANTLFAAAAKESFEAETLLAGIKAVESKTISPDSWCVWTGDSNAAKKWSGGKVLSAAPLKKETVPGQGKFPVLHFKVPVKTDGFYTVKVKFGFRPLAVALNKKGPWQRASLLTTVIHNQKCSAGNTLDFFVSHCFVSEKIYQGPVYIDKIILEKFDGAGLANADFTQKPDAKQALPGWKTFAREAELVKFNPDHAKKELRVSSTTRMDWFFENSGRFPVSAGSRVRFTATLRNPGKRRARAMFTVYESRESKKRSRVLGFAWVDMKPGTSRQIAVCGVAGVKADGCEIRVSGYGAGELVFRDFKFENLGKVSGGSLAKLSGKTVKFDAKKQLYSISGKSWSAESVNFYQGMPGENLTVTFDYRYMSECSGKVRVDIPGFAVTVPGSNALASMELPRVVAGEWSKATLHVPMLPMLNAIKLRLTGDCEVQVKNINVKKCDFIPVGVSHHAKVPDHGKKLRQQEKLGRGVTASAIGKKGSIYISWRILPQDSKDIAFDIYGSADGRKFVKLNQQAVVQTSDFVYKGKEKIKYIEVRPVKSASVSGRTEVIPFVKDVYPYREYRFPASPLKAGIGDLDGDGEYDIVACCGSQNIDPWHVVWQPSGGTYKLVAMHSSGKKLWEFDMSFNIECGVWYAPFMVYDLDGDGCAEVILKGNLPSDGDWREKSGVNYGKVISGPERLLVLNGKTGKIIAHAPWPSRLEFLVPDSKLNLASRNMLACAMLNGKTPAIIALRGTYGLQLVEAWELRDGKLVQLWNYNSREYPRKFHGQGAHTTRVADLDGDGRDEIILGGAVLDDDGKPLWSTGCGHPDFLYVGDLMPQNPGLEVLTIYETANARGGITCADGKTGRVLWALDAPSKHIHRGYAGDIDARFRGVENGGSDSLSGGHYGKLKHRHYTSCGKLLYEDDAAPLAKRGFVNRFAFWDGDLQRELAGNTPVDFRGGACGKYKISGHTVMIADISGDWREEILTRNGNFLRIYQTNIPAMDRRVTLMADPIYRLGIAASSSGYAYDVMSSKLFSEESPNINLTVLPDRDMIEIIVSAPAKDALKGKLRLTAEKGVVLSSRVFDIDLAPGETTLEKVRFLLRSPGRYILRAELDRGNGQTLRAQVPIIR